MHHIFLIGGMLYWGIEFPWLVAVFATSMMWAKFVGSDVMHFYFAHGNYKDTPKSWFYTVLCLCTALGSPISFSASHRQHHAYTDTAKDPHSPAYIGWARVYFLMWEPQKIAPRMIADFARSGFQKWVHKRWIRLHIAIVIVLAIIDPRLVCFGISAFVVYTFHQASSVNTLAHLDGTSENVPVLRLLNWWGWRHGDHHNYKGSN